MNKNLPGEELVDVLMSVTNETEADPNGLKIPFHYQPGTIRKHSLALVRVAVVKLQEKVLWQTAIGLYASLLKAVKATIDGINYQVRIVRKVGVTELDGGRNTCSAS